MLPFTRSEQQAFLFVLVVGLCGGILRLATGHFPHVRAWHEAVRLERLVFKRDLNRASYDELVEVPGIGPAAAQHIIGYRTAHTRFLSLEELRPLIGVKAFGQIGRYLEVKP